MIRKGIHISATDLFKESNTTFSPNTQDTSTSADTVTPSSKRTKQNQDPFVDFRQKIMSSYLNVFSTKRAWTVELDRQIQVYENLQLDSNYDYNLLSFWKTRKDTIDMFANTAKSLFVIPASSTESEHHFFIEGKIVTEQRGLLYSDTDEALILLKEGYSMWSASVTGSKK